MTITSEIRKPNWLIALGLQVLVAISSFGVTQTEKFVFNRELLSNAILIDMLFVAPLLYYLSIRKSGTSKSTVLRIFLVSLIVSGFILDSQTTIVLYYIKTFAYPILETGLLIWVGRSFYMANQEVKKSHHNIDFLILTRKILHKVTGNEKIAAFFAAEIACVYYAFSWAKKAKADYKTTFSTHKDNGIVALLYMLIFILLIETTATHLLLSLCNKTLAWLTTGLSVYTCVQIFAHIRALKSRLITLEMENINIYNGLAAEVILSYNNIKKVEFSNKIPENKMFVKMALLGNLEEHNCIIYLNKPVQVSKFFGMKRQTDTILFYTDQPKDFLNTLAIKQMNNDQ